MPAKLLGGCENETFLAEHSAVLFSSITFILPTQAQQGKNLIVYFSYSGNTRMLANLIQQKTGADIVEIEMVTPYSQSYNACLEESLKDMETQARPRINTHIDNILDYDKIFLGYPTWWATIPMPVASFLEQHDLSDKTIIPFVSHGRGRLGQTITAIAKLCPKADIKEAFSVQYGGGPSLQNDIDTWLVRVR